MEFDKPVEQRIWEYLRPLHKGIAGWAHAVVTLQPNESGQDEFNAVFTRILPLVVATIEEVKARHDEFYAKFHWAIYRGKPRYAPDVILVRSLQELVDLLEDKKEMIEANYGTRVALDFLLPMIKEHCCYPFLGLQSMPAEKPFG